jgi:mannose-6-phosphate isomerase-like protein (cupin superfamily)
LTGDDRPAPPGGILQADELEAFARELAAASTCWRRHVRHDSEARSYQAIWDDAHVNAWVVCWSEEHDTGFHDHDVSAGAITVVRGSVREERLALGVDPLARTFGAGESFYLGASAIHRITHAGEGPAITIHAYSPPLTRQGVYRTTSDGALERHALPFTEELRAETPSLGQLAA